MLGYALLVTIMTMSNEVTPPVLPAARTSAVVAAVWLVLGVLWMGWIAALGALIHEALAGVWFVSDIALAIAVGWWMVRVRRTPRKVVALACWWFPASLAGPPALAAKLARGVRGVGRVSWERSLIRVARGRLALLLLVSIATFPLFWFATMILLALGSAGEIKDEDSLSMQRFAVGVGGVMSAMAVTATILDWISACRRYPPDNRGSFGNLTGVVCGAAVLVALVAAVIFGEWTWSAVLI